MISFLPYGGGVTVKNARYTAAGSLALVLAASTLSVAAVSPAYATGCYCTEPEPGPTRGNNGFGQEKREEPQDGENPGSDNGRGVPSGGPGAGSAGQNTKQNGTGLR